MKNDKEGGMSLFTKREFDSSDIKGNRQRTWEKFQTPTHRRKYRSEKKVEL
jgi:hypothetical protein